MKMKTFTKTDALQSPAMLQKQQQHRQIAETSQSLEASLFE